MLLALWLAVSLLIACTDKDKSEVTAKTVEGKWYTSAQLIRGKVVFKTNCQECHGESAQGLVADWKKPLQDGSYPAPPLNGSAHAWHHSKEALMRTVNMGGIPLGGTMPAFKDKLSEKEKEAVLAHIMNLWSEKTYQAWEKRNPVINK